MDKLRRVLSGEDRTPEEESSIITQVKPYQLKCHLLTNYMAYTFFNNCNYASIVGPSHCKHGLAKPPPTPITRLICDSTLYQLVYFCYFFFELQINDMSTLSWSTRIKAFCICFVLGMVLSFLGSIALFLHRGIVVFAVFYTIGNLVSMAR